MGANTKLATMQEKLPSISSSSRGFHGLGGSLASDQLNVEDVDIQFETTKQSKSGVGLFPAIEEGGILANGAFSKPETKQQPVTPRKISRQQTFLTFVDEDEDLENEVVEIEKQSGNDTYCKPCADRAASEAGKLTEKIMSLKLEADRQKAQFETMKRKLDNTSKELKTAQAMIETLKGQNSEKADRIANLKREATIGLWNREKKKLLQFSDVREASLEYELTSLKDTSLDFKGRALDRIQFLTDQVYKLKLMLNLQGNSNQVKKVVETAEKKLKSAKDELSSQKEEFFKFRRNIVGMLAGFTKDFRFVKSHVNVDTSEANADFWDHAEQFEIMLGDLFSAALSDNLSETVDSLPSQFALSDEQKEHMMERNLETKKREQKLSTNYDSDEEDHEMLSEEEMLKKLNNIEQALQQSSKDIKDFDEKIDMNSINDSGISLNEYEGVSRGGTPGSGYREGRRGAGIPSGDRKGMVSNSGVSGTGGSGNERSVRFQDDEQSTGNSWRKRRGLPPKNTSEKSVQTDVRLPELEASVPSSRRGKRNKKSKSRATTPNGTTIRRKTPPKKMDTNARLKQEQALKKEWLEAQLSASGETSSPKHKSRGSRTTPDSSGTKSRQNSHVTFTHLRELYGEKRVSNLIDRSTGAVDIDSAAEHFPNLPRGGILEGFTHFVQYDSNNDYRLDTNEVVRAISRATDDVVEPEEIKSALFELGVLETDELDFFDFLCIQETLTTGTFDKSKSKMLRMQGLTPSKKTVVSKYCAVM